MLKTRPFWNGLQKYQIYVAKDLSKSTNNEVAHLDGEVEELEIQKFTRRQIDEMITSGEICDNWTLSALYLYDRFKA